MSRDREVEKALGQSPGIPTRPFSSCIIDGCNVNILPNTYYCPVHTALKEYEKPVGDEDAKLNLALRDAITTRVETEISTADMAVGMLSSTDVSVIIGRIKKIIKAREDQIRKDQDEYSRADEFLWFTRKLEEYMYRSTSFMYGAFLSSFVEPNAKKYREYFKERDEDEQRNR